MAARAGGGDAESNPRLRSAVLAAKAENMPADNIKRAIQRGTGELPGTVYEEFTLEGYGPGGVAVLLDITTDNRNRTVSEIRHMMSKNHGNMGEAGCVAWMFRKQGSISIPKAKAGEDELLGIVLDAGADDLRDDGSSWEVLTPPQAFEGVVTALKARKLEPENAEVAMIPQNYIKLEGKDAEQMVKLLDAIDECDDVTHVYSNFDMDEEQLAS
ncbi:MAG: YebC/PmpR family DNA-binding transcriptional regulator [Terriglobales bacterium]